MRSNVGHHQHSHELCFLALLWAFDQTATAAFPALWLPAYQQPRQSHYSFSPRSFQSFNSLHRHRSSRRRNNRLDDDASQEVLMDAEDEIPLARPTTTIRDIVLFPLRKVKEFFQRRRRRKGKASLETPSLLLEEEEGSVTLETSRSTLSSWQEDLATSNVTQTAEATNAPLQQQPVADAGPPEGTDLTGAWTLVVDEEFTQEYDLYLKRLGQPGWIRSIALSLIDRTTEETRQFSNGQSLWIKGTNVRGTWERTLETTNALSSSDDTTLTENSHASSSQTPKMISTADGEQVPVEAWWEGPVHHSWLKGVKNYGGGAFESRRYLENEDTLVCESVFHPNNPKREKASVTWKFARREKPA